MGVGHGIANVVVAPKDQPALTVFGIPAAAESHHRPAWPRGGDRAGLEQVGAPAGHGPLDVGRVPQQPLGGQPQPRQFP